VTGKHLKLGINEQLKSVQSGRPMFKNKVAQPIKKNLPMLTLLALFIAMLMQVISLLQRPVV